MLRKSAKQIKIHAYLEVHINKRHYLDLGLMGV